MDELPTEGKERRLSRSSSSIKNEGPESEEIADEIQPRAEEAPRVSLRDRFRQIGTALTVLRTFTASTSDERPAMKGGSSADRADFRLGIGRSMRAYNLFEEIRVDYIKSLQNLSPDSSEWAAMMQALHQRSAKKCLDLAKANGGLYIKVFCTINAICVHSYTAKSVSGGAVCCFSSRRLRR